MNSLRALRPLMIALAIAFANGLLYVFVAPPWQHYDEPTHFEYAKLIANRGYLPLPGDVDVQLRADIYSSMSRHGFFGEARPAAPTDGSAAEIGITQLADSPLYYMFGAVVIAFARNATIETQLYAVRTASLMFLLITVACGWGIAARLTKPGHRLRWMLPCTLALIPAFVDLMSAVNNDGLAIAAYSLFLLGSVRWLHVGDGERGPYHFFNALWMLVAAGLCFAAKSTSVTAVPIALLALVIGFFDGRARLVVAGVMSVMSLGVTPLLIERDDARGWYRNNASRTSLPIRCSATECGASASDGYAIRVSPGTYPHALAYVFQSFPPAHTAMLRDQTVRISARTWTTSHVPISNSAPWLGINHRIGQGPAITLNQMPQMLSYTTTVPASAHYIRLVLPGHATETVFYDDISVRPIGTILDDDTEGANAQFNAVRFESGEAEAFSLREPVVRALDAISPEWYSWPLTISAIQDLRGTGWYFLIVARYMFETLWLRTAWGDTIPATAWLIIPAMLTALGMAGAIGSIPRGFRGGRWVILVLFGMCLIVTIGPTIPRAIIWGLEERMYAPPIRYALPSIIAIGTLLSVGWTNLSARLNARATCVFLGSVALLLNVLVLYNISTSTLN
jgi:hypothetical protein